MANAIVWFRQDLRLADNPALAQACREQAFILPLYILDEAISPLGGAQRWWLHHSLEALEAGFKKIGLNLCLRKGSALTLLKQLVKDHCIDTIYWNRCYEPATIARDTLIKQFFQAAGITVVSTNGSLLHEPWEITNTSGHFFKVFTPYWRACLKRMNLPAPCTLSCIPNAVTVASEPLVTWKLLPYKPNWASAFGHYWEPGEEGAHRKLTRFIDHTLKGYTTSRDEPAKDSTSKLSPHLHFGEISPQQVWRAMQAVTCDTDVDLASIERFLSEIGWREFSYHLLYYHPTLSHTSFKPNFNAFPWENNAIFLKRWQTGMTGYPIVDAGMRELWHTGYMHNRVRMIAASFLTKDLLIDWRLGANWFLDTLVDADLANNSASWQWVAGCGADAAPYFRIFNPVLQGEKWDPEGTYIKQWVIELQSVPAQWVHKPWMIPADNPHATLIKNYPAPLVDHATAREKALLYYKMLGKSTTPKPLRSL